MTIPDNYLDEYNQTNTNPICRICLNDDRSEEGELIPINPCLCRGFIIINHFWIFYKIFFYKYLGSCEFVHIACLKYWMASKISRKV